MSKKPEGKPLTERVKQLREVEDELRLVANSDVPYAKHAQRYLRVLEEHDETGGR